MAKESKLPKDLFELRRVAAMHFMAALVQNAQLEEEVAPIYALRHAHLFVKAVYEFEQFPESEQDEL